jgi:hypothetical protein
LTNTTKKKRHEGYAANGLRKIQDSSSQQVILMGLMTDITLLLLELQRVLQKTTLVLRDVLTVRDNVVQMLNIISSGPLPSGEEEKFI